MKLNSLFACASLAAVAVAAAFAGPAKAEGMSKLTLCAHSEQLGDCVSVMIPDGAIDEMSREIARCWEDRLRFVADDVSAELAAAEKCMAISLPTDTATALRKHRKRGHGEMKRRHRISRAVRATR